MNYLIEYEVLGYIALFLNLLSFTQKETKKVLLFLTISSLIFILNMFVLDLPKDVIYIVNVGLLVTIISLIFIDNEKIKRILIQMSPLLSLYVVYLFEFTIIGVISGIGFLFATIGKLQNNILTMKIYLLISTIIWLGIMLYIGFSSFIVFYTISGLVITYSIYKDNKLLRPKGTEFSDRLTKKLGSKTCL